MINIPGLKRSDSVRKFIKSRYLLMLFFPCFIWYIIFCYLPMYGVLISFKDYSIFLGFSKSAWIDFAQFNRFFTSPDVIKLLVNTFFAQRIFPSLRIPSTHPACAGFERSG